MFKTNIMQPEARAFCQRQTMYIVFNIKQANSCIF